MGGGYVLLQSKRISSRSSLQLQVPTPPTATPVVEVEGPLSEPKENVAAALSSAPKVGESPLSLASNSEDQPLSNPFWSPHEFPKVLKWADLCSTKGQKGGALPNCVLQKMMPLVGLKQVALARSEPMPTRVGIVKVPKALNMGQFGTKTWSKGDQTLGSAYLPINVVRFVRKARLKGYGLFR